MEELLLKRKQHQAKRQRTKTKRGGAEPPLAKTHDDVYKALKNIAALDTRTCIDQKKMRGRPKAAAAKLASQQVLFALGVDLTAVYSRVGNLCKLVRVH